MVLMLELSFSAFETVETDMFSFAAISFIVTPFFTINTLGYFSKVLKKNVIFKKNSKYSNVVIEPSRAFSIFALENRLYK